jgi:competence protein ComEA
MKIVHILSLAFFLLAATPVAAEVVNINKADAAALAENLNGIGMVKAKEIVKYRDTHGKFESIEELSNIKGIGEKTVEKNRDNMSLSKGVTQVEVRVAKKSSAEE